jgi:hypothetical protein
MHPILHHAGTHVCFVFCMIAVYAIEINVVNGTVTIFMQQLL